MEDKKDLGSKKINNEQEINEGFSGENLPKDYNPAKEKLTTESEKDKDGNQKNVQRARTPDTNKNELPTQDSDAGQTAATKVEHQDRNSDTAKNRYDSDHPDNHKNRGNLELDQE